MFQSCVSLTTSPRGWRATSSMWWTCTATLRTSGSDPTPCTQTWTTPTTWTAMSPSRPAIGRWRNTSSSRSFQAQFPAMPTWPLVTITETRRSKIYISVLTSTKCFKFRHTLIDGFTKVVEVPTNKENRRRIMMHWYSGTTQTDTGFLAKLSVSETP